MVSLDDFLEYDVIPVVDPLILKDAPDDFLTKYGQDLEKICIVSKGEHGFVYYGSASTPSDQRYKEYFSSLATISNDIGLHLCTLVNVHLDSYFGRNPEFQAQDSSGKVSEDFVCPAQDAFLLHIQEITRELIQKFDISQIILKNSMFPRFDYSFTFNARREFSQIVNLDREFGINNIKKDPKIERAWINWRSNKIAQMAHETTKAINNIRKEVTVIQDVLVDQQTNYLRGAKDNFGQDVNLLSKASNKISFHINPWSGIPKEVRDLEYLSILEAVLEREQIIEDSSKIEYSMYVWGIETIENPDIVMKLAEDIGAREIFIQPNYPWNYEKVKEIHLKGSSKQEV